MKKLIILVLISLLILTGCSSNLEKSNIKVENNDIEFIIKENTLTRSTVTLILKNNSDKSLYFGDPYEIEVYEDSSWRKIEADMYFNMPLYELKPGEEKELDFNWEHGYGRLNRGKYRIIKDVYFEKEEKFYIGCEFTI